MERFVKKLYESVKETMTLAKGICAIIILPYMFIGIGLAYIYGFVKGIIEFLIEDVFKLTSKK